MPPGGSGRLSPLSVFTYWLSASAASFRRQCPLAGSTTLAAWPHTGGLTKPVATTRDTCGRGPASSDGPATVLIASASIRFVLALQAVSV